MHLATSNLEVISTYADGKHSKRMSHILCLSKPLSRQLHTSEKFIQVNGTSSMAQQVKDLPAMQETQVWPLGWEDSLEKETATHSSILAWRIPWTEEPGKLQSKEAQRVGQGWVTKHDLIKQATFGGSISVTGIMGLRNQDQGGGTRDP